MHTIWCTYSCCTPKVMPKAVLFCAGREIVSKLFEKKNYNLRHVTSEQKTVLHTRTWSQNIPTSSV